MSKCKRKPRITGVVCLLLLLSRLLYICMNGKLYNGDGSITFENIDIRTHTNTQSETNREEREAATRKEE